MIVYLNINYLRNKIDSLREIIKVFPTDVVCTDQTKLY